MKLNLLTARIALIVSLTLLGYFYLGIGLFDETVDNAVKYISMVIGGIGVIFAARAQMAIHLETPEAEKHLIPEEIHIQNDIGFALSAVLFSYLLDSDQPTLWLYVMNIALLIRIVYLSIAPDSWRESNQRKTAAN